MTPYELNVAINVSSKKQKQEYEKEIALVWLGAKLQRAKSIPDLKKLIGNEQQKKKMTSEEMLNKVKQLNAAFGGTTY
jgi:hypothetical protein